MNVSSIATTANGRGAGGVVLALSHYRVCTISVSDYVNCSESSVLSIFVGAL